MTWRRSSSSLAILLKLLAHRKPRDSPKLGSAIAALRGHVPLLLIPPYTISWGSSRGPRGRDEALRVSFVGLCAWRLAGISWDFMPEYGGHWRIMVPRRFGSQKMVWDDLRTPLMWCACVIQTRVGLDLSNWSLECTAPPRAMLHYGRMLPVPR